MLYQLSHVRVHPYLSNPDARDSTASAGIDVGARLLHVVVLDATARVVLVEAVPAAEIHVLADALADSAPAVAIDAPDRWSTAPHVSDHTLAPKFRSARCAEIGLGRQYRMWVPWTTPTDPREAPEWIHVGIRLFQALRARGHDPAEAYPHAAFRMLNRFQPLPPKRTADGRGRRLALLAEAGVGALDRLGSSHDALDAAAAALVALHRRRGVASAASCNHDGTAIWLPAGDKGAWSPPGVPEPARTPLRP